ncbi:MAG: hypothetical protein HRT81_02220 [Henriciella sp.]|nr:hypothetical protein [Henriciella sp.]
MRRQIKHLSGALIGLAGSAALAISAHAELIDRPHFEREGLVIVWAANAMGAVPMVSDFILDTGNGTSAAGSGDIDLIASDAHAVVTGTLVSTQDGVASATGGMPFLLTNTDSGTIDTDTNGDGVVSGADAFTSFGIQSLSDARVDAVRQSSSFYVASNVPFAIDAQAFTPSTFTEFILLLITRMQLSVTQAGDDGLAFGASAQLPHSGGATAGVAPSLRLWDLRNAQNVFTGNQRTASGPGSLADQAVRFDAEYSIAAANLNGYDLSLGTFDFQVEVVYTVYVP